MPTYAEQLAAARRVPIAELRKHAAVSEMEGPTRCKDCFCCAAAEVLHGLNGGRNMGNTETASCTYPVPPVYIGNWDAAAWDAYLLNHCTCPHHVELRMKYDVKRRDLIGRPLAD